MPAALDAVRYAAAAYLVVLALSAVVGHHRLLLALPVRAAYSLARLALLAFSFGRVRILPLQRLRGPEREVQGAPPVSAADWGSPAPAPALPVPVPPAAEEDTMEPASGPYLFDDA